MSFDKKETFFRDKYWKLWLKSPNYSPDYSDSKLLKILLKYVKSKDVLEVGVGDGSFFLSNIFSKVKSFTGIDISPDLIKKGKLKFNRENITLLNLSIDDDLQFFENQFDLIYCFRTSWYLGDLKKFSTKYFNYLKRDGIILIEIMNLYSIENVYYVVKTILGVIFSKDKYWGSKLTSPFSLISHMKKIGYYDLKVMNISNTYRKKPSLTNHFNVWITRKVLIVAKKTNLM